MNVYEKLNRNEFLKQLGVGGAALLAVYCTGGMIGCSSSIKKDPAPTNAVDFTIDLTASLKTPGSFITQNSVVIVRTTADTFVAVSQLCAHEGQPKVYYTGSGFRCPEHGAEFNLSGNSTNAVTSKSLKVYNTTVTGTFLRVYS